MSCSHFLRRIVKACGHFFIPDLSFFDVDDLAAQIKDGLGWEDSDNEELRYLTKWARMAQVIESNPRLKAEWEDRKRQESSGRGIEVRSNPMHGMSCQKLMM